MSALPTASVGMMEEEGGRVASRPGSQASPGADKSSPPDGFDPSREEYIGPVKVTVTRPDTGEVLEEKTVSNDYMIVCNGSRYVKSWQIWGRTHQVNIAVRKITNEGE